MVCCKLTMFLIGNISQDGGFKNVLLLTPEIVEDEPRILTSVFFKMGWFNFNHQLPLDPPTKPREIHDGFFSPQHIWVLPKIGVPQNGWFIMKIPIKMDDLGKPTILGNPHNMGWNISHQKKWRNRNVGSPLLALLSRRVNRSPPAAVMRSGTGSRSRWQVVTLEFLPFVKHNIQEISNRTHWTDP